MGIQRQQDVVTMGVAGGGHHQPTEKENAHQLYVKMTENQRKYCICRSTDETGFMILCEHCDEWFHGRCVKITEEDARLIKHYYCDKCISHTPTLKISYRRKGTSTMNNKKNGYNEDEDEDTDEKDEGNNDGSRPRGSRTLGNTKKLYYVEEIIDKKLHADGKFRYLVKWADYSSFHNSWEPEENLSSCQYIKEKFERRYQRRKDGLPSESSESEDDDDEENESSENPQQPRPRSSSLDSETVRLPETNGEDEDESMDEDEDNDEEEDEEAENGENSGDDGDGNGDDEEEEETDEDTEQPKAEFCLLESLPEDKTPIKMLLTLPLKQNRLAYMIELKNKDQELEPAFVCAKYFRKAFPQIVIEFYEKHIQLSNEPIIHEGEELPTFNMRHSDEEEEDEDEDEDEEESGSEEESDDEDDDTDEVTGEEEEDGEPIGPTNGEISTETESDYDHPDEEHTSKRSETPPLASSTATKRRRSESLPVTNGHNQQQQQQTPDLQSPGSDSSAENITLADIAKKKARRSESVE